MTGELVVNELKRIQWKATTVFALAPLAEQAMDDAGLTGEEQDELFLELSPEGFTTYDPRVYAAHAAELCARRKEGQDLAPATRAEVIRALCDISLKAPLGQQHGALYEALFVGVFGEDAIDAAHIPEPYVGANSELLAEMRRKLARVRAPRG